MAANDDATLTIGAAEWTYPDRDGMTTHVVTTNQTLVFDLTAAATGTNYRLLDGKSITCTDGTNLTIEADPQFTYFEAAAVTGHRSGAMRVRENDGTITDWEVSDIVLIAAVDEPTGITSCTLTAKDNPMRTCTLNTGASSLAQ